MKKIFVAPEMYVTEIESQHVFAASDDVYGEGEKSIWEGIDDEVINTYGL